MSFESQPGMPPAMPSPALMRPKRPPTVSKINHDLEVQQIIPELGGQPMIYAATDLHERLVRSHPSWSKSDIRTMVGALGDDSRVEAVGDKFLLYRVFPGGQEVDEAQAYIANESRWRSRLMQVIGRAAVTAVTNVDVKRFTDRSTHRYGQEWGQPAQQELQVIKAWMASFMHEPRVLLDSVNGGHEQMPRRRLLDALHDHHRSLDDAGLASTSYEQIRSSAFWEAADAPTKVLFAEHLPWAMRKAGFEAISQDSELLVALPVDGDSIDFLEHARSINSSVNDIVQQYVNEGWLSISNERITEQLRAVLNVPAEHATLPLACLQNHPLLRQEDDPNIFTIVQKGSVIKGRIISKDEL